VPVYSENFQKIALPLQNALAPMGKGILLLQANLPPSAGQRVQTVKQRVAAGHAGFPAPSGK